MLFANDIILIDEKCSDVKYGLEVWRRTLKAKGFKSNKTKIEYLECKFNKELHEKGVEV